MIYADYSFYRGDYMGNVIPGEEAFTSAVRDASEYIDYITHGRIAFDDLPKSVQNKVKMAACAVSDICYRQNKKNDFPTVSSETVGNHSKTFSVSNKSASEWHKEKLMKAKLYLHGTGLMYGGLK